MEIVPYLCGEKKKTTQTNQSTKINLKTPKPKTETGKTQPNKNPTTHQHLDKSKYVKIKFFLPQDKNLGDIIHMTVGEVKD